MNVTRTADSSGNKNWLKAVIYLFESTGFQLNNLTDYLELYQQTVLKKVKQNYVRFMRNISLKQLKTQTG